MDSRGRPEREAGCGRFLASSSPPYGVLRASRPLPLRAAERPVNATQDPAHWCGTVRAAANGTAGTSFYEAPSCLASVAYVAGMEWVPAPDGGVEHLIITYGVADWGSRILRLSMAEVLDLFKAH